MVVILGRLGQSVSGQFLNGVFGVGSLVEIVTDLGSGAIVSTGDDNCKEVIVALS